MTGKNPQLIRLHAHHNVVIALRNIKAGETVEGLVGALPAAVAQGHKLATCTLDTGEYVRRYGQIIGQATALIAIGEHVHSHNLGMWLDVDGHRYQNGSSATMVYKIPFLIAYCSQFMSLQLGDIISTGTPPGVGMGQNPPVYLRGGETISSGIDKLGVQTQKVRAAI